MSDSGSTPPDPNQPYPQQPPSYGQQPYPQQPQPYGQPAYGQPYGSPPPNHLVWAILSTVLCCLPLGIVSIVFSTQVNSKYAAGDLAGAQAASRKAKNFAIWSAVLGVVGTVILVAIAVAGGASDSTV